MYPELVDKLASHSYVALLGIGCPQICSESHWALIYFSLQRGMALGVHFQNVTLDSGPGGNCEHRVHQSGVVSKSCTTNNGYGLDVHCAHPCQGPSQSLSLRSSEGLHGGGLLLHEGSVYGGLYHLLSRSPPLPDQHLQGIHSLTLGDPSRLTNRYYRPVAGWGTGTVVDTGVLVLEVVPHPTGGTTPTADWLTT